jgi:hypothetical protein
MNDNLLVGEYGDHRVAQLTPSGVDVVLLRAPPCSSGSRQILFGFQPKLTVSFPVLLSTTLFQPLTKNPVSEFVVERAISPGRRNGSRNGVAEQNAARVVPVVLGLNDLSAVGSQTADIDLSPLPTGVR